MPGAFGRMPGAFGRIPEAFGRMSRALERFFETRTPGIEQTTTVAGKVLFIST